MKHWKALLILSIGLSIQGCSTVYRQAGLEKVSRSEFAVIEVESCGDDCPTIQEIDGAWRGVGSFKEFEVKPGTRTVKFIYMKGGLSGTRGLIVSFEAKQGEVYGVRANADHLLKKWRPEIIDKSTGRAVSRLVGTGFAY